MLFQNASEFSIKDASTRPYVHMIESVDESDIEQAGGIEAFVRAYARNMAMACTFESKASGAHVYKVWRSGWEFNQAVRELTAALAER